MYKPKFSYLYTIQPKKYRCTQQQYKRGGDCMERNVRTDDNRSARSYCKTDLQVFAVLVRSVFPHSPHPSIRGYLVNLANVRPAFFLSGSSRDPLYNVIRISCKHACRANVLQPLVLGLLFETRIKYYDIYITNIHWRCGPWRMQRRETVYIKRSTFITFCLQFTL